MPRNIKPERIDIKNDNRGYVVELARKNKIKEVLLITINEGAVRGNHYHKSKKEWLYIVSGYALMIFTDVKSGIVTKLPISAPALFKIPINTVHTIKNLSMNTLYIIELSNQIYSQTPDTIKCPI